MVVKIKLILNMKYFVPVQHKTTVAKPIEDPAKANQGNIA